MFKALLYLIIALAGLIITLLVSYHSRKYQSFMVRQLNLRDSEYDEIYANHDES